jgi:methanesulfonate monooxygenase small subunit
VVTIAGDEAHRLAYHELAQLVYSGVLLLDAKDFAGWLDLCADDFSYAIRAWSPEIRKDITWLEHDLDGIATLVRQLPRHNTDHSIFTRHATVYTVNFDDGQDTAGIVSAVSIYRTELDGGATGLFAVGRYHDRAVRSGGRWRLRSRELRLDTRSLGIGTHYPL